MTTRIKWFKGNAKAWITFSPTSRPRKVLKHKLLATKSYINKHPKFKRKLINILDNFPSLKTRLQKVGKTHTTNASYQTLSYETLSPQAQDVHDQLNKQIKNNQGK